MAIQSTLKRLYDAQQHDPPARRARQVQLGPAPEHESLKDLMTTAVVTTFYRPPPQLDQFKACVGDAWGSLPNVRILQIRAMARRDSDPIPPCPPGPTDIAVEEFQQLNQGSMAIHDSPPSTEAVWRENTTLHPVSFVQLLNQQSIGAHEAAHQEDQQPMEEEVQSSTGFGQVESQRAVHQA
ncbi:hypothetical protein R1sor_026688 [Riccia sorocarpa]|uniref:Uncharacterized protein n=1 Tax=Riccia sorocarpa TaxID=122646 RepID=A0ABD3GC55_9MARC